MSDYVFSLISFSLLMENSHVRLSTYGISRLLLGCGVWSFAPGQCTTKRLMEIGLDPYNTEVVRAGRSQSHPESCQLKVKNIDPESGVLAQVVVDIFLPKDAGVVEDYIRVDWQEIA